MAASLQHLHDGPAVHVQGLHGGAAFQHGADDVVVAAALAEGHFLLDVGFPDSAFVQALHLGDGAVVDHDSLVAAAAHHDPAVRDFLLHLPVVVQEHAAVGIHFHAVAVHTQSADALAHVAGTELAHVHVQHIQLLGESAVVEHTLKHARAHHDHVHVAAALVYQVKGLAHIIVDLRACLVPLGGGDIIIGEVEVKQQELAATVEKVAEAEKYKAERDAEAELARKQREAEAVRYAAEQEAAGIKAKYDAEAAGIAAKGLAEAEAIKAKGLAEAEAMEKRAEAYKKYNSAAIVEMMIKIMPQMASEIAKPLSSIDSINIYGTGDGNSGATQISGNMPIVMKQVFDTMSQATGVDLSEIIRANTYDAKVTRNVNVTGMPGVQPAQTTAEEAKE